MRSLLRIGPLTVLLLALPAAAGAKTIHSTLFRSPTKQILCGLNVKAEGLGITCSASYLPHTELDGYIKLKPHGKAIEGERGDDPWKQGKTKTLHYGEHWSGSGIRCTMRATGLTCTNRSHHGFAMSRQAQKFF